MKKSLLLLVFASISIYVLGQRQESYLELVKAESQLKSLFDAMYNEEMSGPNTYAYEKIDSLFASALSLPGSFDFPWEKLNKIGKLESDDGQLKIFSWYFMENPGDFNYSCYFQIKGKKNQSTVYKLIPSEENSKRSEIIKQQWDDWNGKVYYEIVTKKVRRKTLYTILGADFNDLTTMIKTIEVVAIQMGKPVFKKELFLDGSRKKDRVVFEYSSELAASVHYDKNLDMIVFDHLAPLHPIYENSFQFYGPDGSYDGYVFNKGTWIKEEDVDARNR